MVTIEVDEDVYNKIQSLAEPFVDTPNTVLRRLLFSEQKGAKTKPRNNVHTISKAIREEQGLSPVAFMNWFLKNRYSETFRAKSPHSMMFESEKHLVYFQNFSKVGTSDLWYRLSKDPLNILRNTQKIALVCFTNPSENIVFEIPINDIDKRAAETKWIKDFFEVNIDPANSLWRELNLNIERYLVNFKA